MRLCNKIILFFSILMVSLSCFANTWYSANGVIPRRAFKSGYERDGKALYLCRARVGISVTPGKTWRGYNKCNVPFSGKELLMNSYSIYSGHVRGHWVRAFAGRVPRHAWKVGADVNGTPLYLCRASYYGGLQPGKTWPGYAKCNITYNGREILMSSFSILVRQDRWRPEPAPIPGGIRQCITGPLGNRVCGYNCVRSMNSVACAGRPDRYCQIIAPGEIRCGRICKNVPEKITKTKCRRRSDGVKVCNYSYETIYKRVCN